MTPEERADDLIRDHYGFAAPTYEAQKLKGWIAAAIEAAILEEREACASSCQNRLGSCIQTRDRTGMDPNDAWREGFLSAVRSDAEGIRGRSQYSAEFRAYLAECREGREQAARWEREACARLADGSDIPEDERGCPSQTALNIAKAIRARS